MITISVLGLDQYVVGHYSKDHSKNLADLFEISEDDLLFYAPSSYVFHKGVEQTSWNCIVRVDAPEAYKECQEAVAKYILDTLKDFCINVYVEFRYIDEKDTYEYVSKEYPHFISEDNLVNLNDSSETNEENSEDIFAQFEKSLNNN